MSSLRLLTMLFIERGNNMNLLKDLLFIRHYKRVFTSNLSFLNAIFH